MGSVGDHSIDEFKNEFEQLKKKLFSLENKMLCLEIKRNEQKDRLRTEDSSSHIELGKFTCNYQKVYFQNYNLRK